MNLHLFELFRSQPPRLADDVVRYRKLADIMQQGRCAQCVGILVAQFHLFRDGQCICPHAVQMPMGRVVLGVDCQRQRFDRTHVQRGYLFHVPLLGLHLQLLNTDAFLLLFQTAEVQMIGTVQPIHHRQH